MDTEYSVGSIGVKQSDIRSEVYFRSKLQSKVWVVSVWPMLTYLGKLKSAGWRIKTLERWLQHDSLHQGGASLPAARGANLAQPCQAKVNKTDIAHGCTTSFAQGHLRCNQTFMVAA